MGPWSAKAFPSPGITNAHPASVSCRATATFRVCTGSRRRPAMSFHVMNAFDEEGAVVLDVVRRPRVFDRERRGPSEGDPQLVRWRIDLASGRLSQFMLEERDCEFPRFNDAFGGKPYRYGYTVSAGNVQEFGPTFKHDMTTGRTEVHDYGPGRSALEPVFIAREGATAEDDGWVMSYVYNA